MEEEHIVHFAQIDENNVVVNIAVCERILLLDHNGIEQEEQGKRFMRRLVPGTTIENFVQTFPGGSSRKNYAVIGGTYNNEIDAFVPPKPFDSWVLNEETGLWDAPTPQTDPSYVWDEQTLQWIENPNPTTIQYEWDPISESWIEVEDTP